MTSPALTGGRYAGVHPPLEPTRYQAAPLMIQTVPISAAAQAVPVSWVLRGEFEVEMESQE